MDDYLVWVVLGALVFSALAWTTAMSSFKVLAKTHHIVDVLALRISEQDEVIERLERLAETHQRTLSNVLKKLDALPKT